MHHPPRERIGIGARLTPLLLLGLAVAACGGGDTGRTGQNGDSAQARTAGATRAAPSQLAAPQCPPPPAIDTTFFTDSTWLSLQTWREQHNVRFTGRTATARVLIDTAGADSAKLTIQSERRTRCMGRDSAVGHTRIAGVFVFDSAATAFGQDFEPGDTLLVFSRDTAGPAVLAFEGTDGRVHTAPPGLWKFFFCHDGHQRPDPTGEWRPFDQPPRRPPGDGEDPGTYGWMACASGCCQFYIPPKTPEEPGRRGAGGPAQRDKPFCKPVP